MSRPAFEQYTPEELDAKIQAILDKLEEDNLPLLVEDIAIGLGCSMQTLWVYKNADPADEECPEAYKAYSDPIKRGYLRCQRWNARQLYDRYPTGAIFNAKCNYGYQETPTRLDLGGTGFIVQLDTRAADESSDES